MSKQTDRLYECNSGDDDDDDDDKDPLTQQCADYHGGR